MGATPGPWLLDRQLVYALDETGNCNRFSVRVEGGWSWRGAGSIGASGDRTCEAELDANARLIAAAPMLLEAADDAVKAFRLLRIGMAHEPKAVEVIDAHVSELEYAITKAQGEN